MGRLHPVKPKKNKIKGYKMQEQEFYIGQKFYTMYPPAAAMWCNAKKVGIEEKHEQQESEMGVTDVRYYEICETPETPAPTKEQQSERRRLAYIAEKDPITCQIQSLRDEEQTEEVVAEINRLIEERAEVVAEIKERYPYPDEQP